MELQDFDNDGWPDIYVSLTVDTPDGAAPLIFRHNGNSGDPTFSLASNIPSIQNPQYYAGGPTADFNGDGKLDIFLAEWRSTLGTPVPSRLMQNTGAPGNWLQVRVDGSSAAGENESGVGALIKIYKAGTSQLLGAREISPSFGWSSSQPAVAHFGLGNERFVDVVVQMPFSGAQYRRNNIPANRMLTMPNGISETPAHLGLETSAITISTSRFLTGPSGLPSHTVAQTAPVVEFMPFDLANHAGNPWSTWGGALYASNGRFYAAIGDHLTIDGNSYLYEYDLITKKLKAVGDINTAAGHVPGNYGHGKIHSQIDEGGDGYIYMTSYRGSARGITFNSNFKGGVIVRYPVGAAGSISSGTTVPPSATPTPGPSPTPTPTPIQGSQTHSVVFSTSADRANPTPLHQAVVAGDIYAFTTPDTGVGGVSFYLDDPSMSGTAWRVEGAAPYDFAGGAVAASNPFSTAGLSDGQHTISALFDMATGPDVAVHAIFTVTNTSGTPVPTPTSTPAPVPTPTAAPAFAPTATARRRTATATATPTPSPAPVASPTPSPASTVAPEVDTINLRQGWNLISFQALPENRAIDRVFEQIDGLYTEVSTIHEGSAMSFKPDRTVNTLTGLAPAHGYWVKMTSAATLVVVGSSVDPQAAIQLDAGWNLVPYLIDEPWPVRLALGAITGKYDEVRGFETEAKSFFPALPGEFNTLTELMPGEGYLVHMTEAAVLVYP